MTIENNKVYKSAIIAPRIRNLQEHPLGWGWVAIGDLLDVLNQDANTVWFQFCHDARQATQSEDWSGKSWKVAVPEGDGYVVKDVWDNRTGNILSISNCPPENLLVPAGWYKIRNKAADQLDEALRGVFKCVVQRKELSFRNVNDCKTIEKLTESDIVQALTAVGTVSQLEWTLSRIVSHPNGLEMTRMDCEDENIIYLRFKNRSVLEFMSVCLWIRMVVGEIKLHQYSISDM